MDAFVLPFLVMALIVFTVLNFWHGQKYLSIISSILIFFSILLSIMYIVAGTFTGKGIDESVIFHLMFGLDQKILSKFTNYIILISLLMFSSTVWLIWFNLKRLKTLQTKKKMGTAYFNFFLTSLVFVFSAFLVLGHPATANIYELYNLTTQKERFSQFEQYVKPVRLTYPIKSKPKNFIYIYTESLERTFLNQQRFPNLMPNIRQMEKKAVTITGIKQAPMTNWTIAGMTASQCGIPLATYTENRNNDLNNMNTFLPGAICVGNFLEHHNYYLGYLGGADLEFAGKGKFYADRRFKDIYGFRELEKFAGHPLASSKWGAYDDDLYNLLFKYFEKVASEHKRFGIIALTLDTHAPLGHETPSCKGLQYQDGSKKMLNSISCADKLLAEFIEKFQLSPYAEDTVLIIGSDHFMMNSDAGLEIDDNARENLWIALNTGMQPQVIHRNATTLDIAPTLLSILGFDVNEFALGRNLFSKQPTLSEEIGQEKFYEGLQAWRMNFWKYWDKSNSLSEADRF
ncbi:sulfatase-like hydrolase/transferase [Acinetobacter pittii]|uniref:Sulfatase-like hydrolase/transferase n=1 Tax=Acinetobacter haemolyticus TaxID=29430 RepID=A0AAW4J265_ACIHA|nr:MULTISPECIES: sulfatase-like hydrolase/transferase [Acinetobacter]MBN6532935.1 sulfatase-like hydrolase/transferase [Acinetobacter pittii]MBO3657006.1 sulfatase-like hydrolase/transferase [Acinetobacter haemolyticus]